MTLAQHIPAGREHSSSSFAGTGGRLGADEPKVALERRTEAGLEVGVVAWVRAFRN